MHEKVDGIPNENNIPITDERVINNEGGVVGNSTAKCDESGMGVKIKQETVNKKDETRAKVRNHEAFYTVSFVCTIYRLLRNQRRRTKRSLKI